MTQADTLRKIKKLTTFNLDVGFANLDHGEALDLIMYINWLAKKSLRKGVRQKKTTTS